MPVITTVTNKAFNVVEVNWTHAQIRSRVEHFVYRTSSMSKPDETVYRGVCMKLTEDDAFSSSCFLRDVPMGLTIETRVRACLIVDDHDLEFCGEPSEAFTYNTWSGGELRLVECVDQFNRWSWSWKQYLNAKAVYRSYIGS